MKKEEEAVVVYEVPLTRSLRRKLFPPGARRLRVSNVSLYSMTRPDIAKSIARHIASLEGVEADRAVVTDAFANVGGAAIALARKFARVRCCERDPLHCRMLHDNVAAYGLADKVDIFGGDYLRVIGHWSSDVVFLDPPWGGPAYIHQNKLRLMVNGRIHVGSIIKFLLKHRLAKWVVLLLPPNLDIEDLARRVPIHHTQPLGRAASIAVFRP